MISPETNSYQATAGGLDKGRGVTLFKRGLGENEFFLKDLYTVSITGMYALCRKHYEKQDKC